MAMSALPQETPVVLQAAALSNLYPTDSPTFFRDDKFNAKVVTLHCVGESTFIIRSADDGQELIVGANGGCYFESPVLGITEEFQVEAVANGSIVFVSCRTGNVLDCDDNGLPRCVDTIRRGWFILQDGGATDVNDELIVEVEPELNPPCSHCTTTCRNNEAKERREFIMKLVSLGKSLDEIDAILLRMHAWPIAENIISAGPRAAIVEGGVTTKAIAPWQ
ncbi:hypothetical protein PPTG_18733 [Phytophthora nicotianae INRA-310]|uniref:Uncharacterized protein n=3 Tax=Phytophthora nicotianae TaxID=4792 RepID=W2PGW8_PHYN3|nr:hypothetical protein PPTG_18733 [Phytophthora nicotianae INRA-310]ETM99478.1 hypothetical protein PPTG_18733 [Phytophthora nicotianae INRA-310]KUF85067.1 hypothetical protein AM587_10000050 [Phytophthora nicotianae]